MKSDSTGFLFIVLCPWEVSLRFISVYVCVRVPICNMCMHCMLLCVLLLTPSACSGKPAKTKPEDKLRKERKRNLRIRGRPAHSSALQQTTPHSQETETLSCCINSHYHVYVSQVFSYEQGCCWSTKTNQIFYFPSLLLHHCLTHNDMKTARSY